MCLSELRSFLQVSSSVILEVSSVLSPLPGNLYNPRLVINTSAHPPPPPHHQAQSSVSHALARNGGVLFSPTALEPDADVHALRLVPTSVWCAQYAHAQSTILLSDSRLVPPRSDSPLPFPFRSLRRWHLGWTNRRQKGSALQKLLRHLEIGWEMQWKIHSPVWKACGHRHLLWWGHQYHCRG